MKIIKLTLLVCGLISLCGCRQNRLFANYRELDHTELIQTIGLDKSEGEAHVTVATGVSESGAFTIFTGKAATISKALAEIHTFPTKKFLFLGHTHNILIGSDMLHDMLECLDFLERSVDMRLDTPFFVVRGCTAKEMMRQAKVGDAGVTELLQPLTDESSLGSDNHVFTTKEIISVLTAEGYALAYAVQLTTDQDKISEGEANIIPAGYAVIRHGGVIGYIDYEDCLGVNLLINRAVNGIIPLSDGKGGFVSVSLATSGSKVKGNFDGNNLKNIQIDINISANIEQVQNDLDISDPAVIEMLEKELSQTINDYCASALKASRELQTDFLGLGKRVSVADPLKFEKAVDDWNKVFPQMPVKIKIDALIERTYDILKPKG